MQGVMDKAGYEAGGRQNMLTQTDGNGSYLPPIVYVAERNEDGEGDGRRVAAAIDMMEAHANGDNVFAIRGLRMAEIVSAQNLKGKERVGRVAALSIPTGRISLRHNIPDLLN